MFENINSTRSGELTIAELEEHVHDEAVQAYFTHLNLEIEKAWDIFRIIDRDKSGTVSIEEFVGGCLRLRGVAKTMDLAQVTYDLKSFQTKLTTFMHYVEDQFKALQRKDLMDMTLRHSGKRMMTKQSAVGHCINIRPKVSPLEPLLEPPDKEPDVQSVMI